jgi:stress-induced morphogen
VIALTREEIVDVAGDDFAVVVVAAAVQGLARLYRVEAVMPSVRSISKGMNP